MCYRKKTDHTSQSKEDKLLHLLESYFLEVPTIGFSHLTLTPMTGSLCRLQLHAYKCFFSSMDHGSVRYLLSCFLYSFITLPHFLLFFYQVFGWCQVWFFEIKLSAVALTFTICQYQCVFVALTFTICQYQWVSVDLNLSRCLKSCQNYQFR